jgi:hypothetical protein
MQEQIGGAGEGAKGGGGGVDFGDFRKALNRFQNGGKYMWRPLQVRRWPCASDHATCAAYIYIYAQLLHVAGMSMARRLAGLEAEF